ncbi:MAG: antitoxin VapB family protein [Candidatus Thorarchaeota archaeon]
MSFHGLLERTLIRGCVELSVMSMARHIVVADDIYEHLKHLKKPGESFSNVIRRILDCVDNSGLLERSPSAVR